jgi:hypothetical protein
MYFRSHSDKAIGVMEGLVASAKLGVERHGGDPDSSLRTASVRLQEETQYQESKS